jgi:hypothetical protein
MPVLIRDAILHWHPKDLHLVVVLGTMRLHRVIVVGEEGDNDNSGHVLSECEGAFEIPAGGSLLLKSCVISPLTPEIAKATVEKS